MGFKPVFPIIITADYLSHPENKKTVTLYGDMHEKNLVQLMRMVGYSSDESFAKFIEVWQRQLLKIEDTVTDLLEHDNEAKTCVITETNSGLLDCMFEQEAGFYPSDKLSDQFLARVTRLLLAHVIKDGATPQEKKQMYIANATAVKTQDYLKSCYSVILQKNISWIIGDRWRTKQDEHMMFTVLQTREQIMKALQEDNGASLSEQIRELSIDFVRNRIMYVQDCCLRYGLDDNYNPEILNIIDAVLEKSGLSPSHHMAELYTHLLNNGETDLMGYLNNIIISGSSLLMDVELKHYMDAINKSSECDSVIVVAGVAHIELLKKMLVKQGYQEIKPQEGIQDTIKDFDTAALQGNLQWLKSYCEKALDQAPL